MRGSRTFRVTAVAGDGRSPGRALTVRATVLAVLCSRAIAARVRALFQFFFRAYGPPFASVLVSHTSGDTQRLLIGDGVLVRVPSHGIVVRLGPSS